MMGFGGMRLLLGVTGVLDLIIPVLCVFLRIKSVAQRGKPQAWREFPQKELS